MHQVARRTGSVQEYFLTPVRLMNDLQGGSTPGKTRWHSGHHVGLSPLLDFHRLSHVPPYTSISESPFIQPECLPNFNIES
jgi:hypothetical protein